MANKTIRVNIPRNPLELLKLASQIYAKTLGRR